MSRVRSDVFFSGVLAAILTFAIIYLFDILPVKMENERLLKESEKIIAEAVVEMNDGEVGCKADDSIQICESIEEIMATTGKFTVPLSYFRQMTSSSKPYLDDEYNQWLIVYYEDQYIPIIYNYRYSDDEEYSPVGIVVRNDSSGYERASQVYGKTSLAPDVYIDMDGGYTKKFSDMNALKSEAENAKYKLKNVPSIDNLDAKGELLMLCIIPLWIIIHFIGAKIGIFPPIFGSRRE